MAKVRVYELAKELGVESKTIMNKLGELGEFVRSASSTIEPPVVRKLRDLYPAGGGASTNGAGSTTPTAPKAATAPVKAPQPAPAAAEPPSATEPSTAEPVEQPDEPLAVERDTDSALADISAADPNN